MGLGLVSSGDIMLLTVVSSLVVAALCALGLRLVCKRDELSGNLSLTVIVLNAGESVLNVGMILIAYARALSLGWISKSDKPSLLSSLLTKIILSSLFSSSTNFFFAE